MPVVETLRITLWPVSAMKRFPAKSFVTPPTPKPKVELVAGPLSPQLAWKPQLSQPATEVIVNPCAWDGVGTKETTSPIRQAVNKGRIADLAVFASAPSGAFHLALLEGLPSPKLIPCVVPRGCCSLLDIAILYSSKVKYDHVRVGTDGLATRRQDGEPDRKSTRLNFSH